ncbi:MAG: hypothetical protein K2O00_03620 [Muribaculaceae bacterium]|nr:hypothetical protein [Muribaculaceae bacterium]
MIKKFAIICCVALSLFTVSCNSSSDDPDVGYAMTSVAVRSFSLEPNEHVLNNLDSVFFSVDLQNAKIYNADSLPIHTKVNKLVVNITTVGSSIAELSFRSDSGRDTTVNYLKNSTDSINFANGPVNFHIVSLDGTVTRDYEIKVNVHKMKPDSLYWNRYARRNLPSLYQVPVEQKSVKFGDRVITLTSNGADGYALAWQTDPSAGAEKISKVEFGFTPDVNSFASTDDKLYILDGAGNLYSSADGETWQKNDSGWFSLIGGQKNQLLGVKRIGNEYYTCSYPSQNQAVAPDHFPVRGASQMVHYSTEWSQKSVSVMVGGVDKDGNRGGYTWCYDGSQWALISKKPIPAAEGYSLFAYDYVRTDTVTWKPVTKPVIVAVGGMKADRTFNRDTWMSYDLGYNWTKAPQLMQLPDYIPGMFDAQCFVMPYLEKSRAADGWQSYPSPALPSWLFIEAPVSRAVTPVTEWTIPYIYRYGGYNENYQIYNTVWRGVINRLSFKPIQ